VSSLWPPTGLLFIPQVTDECGESLWNDTDRGNLKMSEKNLSQRHFDHYKSHIY
jgi:hypothetical protein